MVHEVWANQFFKPINPIHNGNQIQLLQFGLSWFWVFELEGSLNTPS